MTTAIARITACLPILAALLSTPAWADSMQFTNFDGPGNNGGGTTVNAINNNGAVVGFSTNNASTPTLFTNFIRNPNGTFTTLNVNNDPLANANGINDNNVVVAPPITTPSRWGPPLPRCLRQSRELLGVSSVFAHKLN